MTLKGFVNNGLLCLKSSSNGLVTIVLSLYGVYISPLNKGLLCLKYSSDLLFIFLISRRLITGLLGIFTFLLKQQQFIGLGSSLNTI